MIKPIQYLLSNLGSIVVLILLSFGAPSSGFAQEAPHNPIRTAQANDTFAVWQDGSYQGANDIFGPGIYFFSDQVSDQIDGFNNVTNDSISSVNAGANVVAWMCNGYQRPAADGSRNLLGCDVFTSGGWTNLSQQDLNDSASVIVVNANKNLRSAIGLRASADSNQNGTSQDFKAGWYDFADIVNGVGNDSISSIEVMPGFIGVVCDNGISHASKVVGDQRVGAECRVYPAGSYNDLDNLNDLISFISVVRVDTNPARVGSFGAVKNWPYAAIHQYLLTDGRVMFNQNSKDDGNTATPEYGIWDPATDSVITESTFAPGSNLFCGAFVHLPNGNLFGASVGGGGATVDTTAEYDMNTGRWNLAPTMNLPRYYPTASVTPNGSVLVTGGNDVFGQVYVQGVTTAVGVPEIYENGSWRSLPGAEIPFTGLRGATNDSSYWPWVQAAPNGQMFVAGPDTGMRFIDTQGQGNNFELGNRDNVVRTYGSYVTYDTGKMLIAGGGNSVASASVISFTGNSPNVTPIEDLQYGRRQHDMTLLADGTVFVNGGNSDGAVTYSAPGTIYMSELWNSTDQTWLAAADSLISRQYHSSSMLIPDGRVVTAGQCAGPPCQKNAELYSPPYLFNDNGSVAARPSITSVSNSWNYSASVNIGYSVPANAGFIDRAHLIKLGAVTHATNFEQRLVPLTITADNGGNSLSVTAPSGGNIAPPGHYMLVIVDGNGVPSVARIVQVGVSDSTGGQPTENLALNKPATQSSTGFGGVASRAVDGNTNGTFKAGSVTHTVASSQNPWWRVDLGASYKIDQINVFNRTDCCSDRLNSATVYVGNVNSTNPADYPFMGTLTGSGAAQTLSGVNANGRYVMVRIAGQGTLSLAELQVFGAQQTAGSFVPDPNKIYHIDNPAHGLRLAATADSEILESRSLSSSGVNTQWRFVQSPTAGLWHIDRVAGGSTPRIRSVLTTTPDMQGTASSGTRTRFSITANSSRPGTYLLTVPEAPTQNQRLRLLSNGTTDFSTNNNTGANPSFVFVEVN